MAHIGDHGYLVLWQSPLPEEPLAEKCSRLLGIDEEPDFNDSRKFIIRDWFGPFLFAPPRYLHQGRC